MPVAGGTCFLKKLPDDVCEHKHWKSYWNQTQGCVAGKTERVSQVVVAQAWDLRPPAGRFHRNYP